MTVESSGIHDRKSSADFGGTRLLLVVVAVSFLFTIATFQTLLSLLTILLFLVLATTSLLVGVVILIKYRNRQSLFYAAALLLSIPAWVFGTKWIAIAAMEINHDRARAFIAEVKAHVERTGDIPATKEALSAANIRVPSAILGFEMRYRLENLSAWPYFPPQTASEKPGTKALAFTISFEAGVMVSCTHTAWNNSFYCDD